MTIVAIMQHPQGGRIRPNGRSLHFPFSAVWSKNCHNWKRCRFTTVSPFNSGPLLPNVESVNPFTRWKLQLKYSKTESPDPHSNNFWASKENSLNYVKYLSKELQIQNMEDWYEVSRDRVMGLDGGISLFKEYLYLTTFLQSVYPDYEWQFWKQRPLPYKYWSNPDNVRTYMAWLATRLKVKKITDWYYVTKEDIVENYGYQMLRKYGPFIAVLEDVFPNYAWYPWHFEHFPLPDSYWEEEVHVNKYVEWMSEQLNISYPDQWYDKTKAEVSQFNGKVFNVHFSGGLMGIFLDYYPDYPWLPWKWTNIPARFWDRRENVMTYLQWFAELMDVKTMEDWYAVSRDSFAENYGQTLLTRCGNVENILKTYFPEYRWQKWLFAQYPEGYWEDEEFWDKPTNIREYLDGLATELGLKCAEDWYPVTRDTLKSIKKTKGRKGATSMLNVGLPLFQRKGGLYYLVMDSYPEYEWQPWKFKHMRESSWDYNLVETYLLWVANELQMQTFERWYSVTREQLTGMYGFPIVRQYGSVHGALTTHFPDVNWQGWRFPVIPEGYWDDEKNVRVFMEWMMEKLHITCPDDWYNVSREQIEELGGASLLTRKGGLIHLLVQFYPNFKWDVKFMTSRTKGQQWLLRAIKSLLPAETLVKTRYKHPQLGYQSKMGMELDVFIPSLSLAIEYQGQQHYMPSYLWGPVSVQKNRDQDKREACERAGITLVQIPYWWDRRIGSLNATLSKHSPQYFSNPTNAAEIPTVIPNVIPPVTKQETKAKPKKRSNRGPKPSTGKQREREAFQLLPARKWALKRVDPTGWWVCPKYADGVRAYWNGTSKFFTRLGDELHSPEALRINLPKECLDGELYSRSFKASEELLAVLSGNSSPEDLMFRVFDAVNHKGTYAERHKHLEVLLHGNPRAYVIEVTPCKNEGHLLQLYRDIVGHGHGDALQIREPTRKNYGETSQDAIPSLMEVQKCVRDIALVVEHLPDGHLLCENKMQSRFEVKTYYYYKEHPPEVGSVVEFKFIGVDANRVPKHPFLHRVITNVTWEDIPLYHLMPNKQTKLTTCRGCRKPLLDFYEPRVVTKGLFCPNDTEPYQVLYSFCVNLDCLNLSKQESKHGVVYLPFDGKVGVPYTVHVN